MRSNIAQTALTAATTSFLLGLVMHLYGGISVTFQPHVSKKVEESNIVSSMAKSERLWRKTVNQRAEVRRKHNDFGGDFFPARDSPSYFSTPYSVWDLIPASWNCPFDVERIGRMGDGGKWVCGMTKYEINDRPCILYSFGVQNESSFEQEMLERTNCEIWGYDFSVSDFGPALQSELQPRTHFTQAGISGESGVWRDPPYYSIQDLMEKNGHGYIDILKIDIEYAEFNALSSLVQYTTDSVIPIGQMLIELHLFGEENITLTRFMSWWEGLEAKGLRPAWTEPNLLSVTMGFNNKNPIMAEYTLVNAKDMNNILWR